MHRVKFNDYAELLSDDLNNNNAYLYNGLITTISDFIAANDCVSGLEVTAQAVPDMTVYVKSGRIYQNGYQGLLEADLTTPLTIAPASSNQPRIDLICAKYEEVEDEPEIRNVMTDVVSRNITQVEVKTRIASSIVFQVVGGTAAAEPTVPTTPEGWVALAKVTVPANASVIQQSNIVDMRPEIINIYQHDHSGGANGAKLDYNNLNNLPDLSDFTGATAEAAGKRGMVPAPAAGENNKFLRGDGTWADAKMSTKELVDILYPVGHIYMSTNSANPGTLFPGTTWEAYAQGRVLIGAGTGTDSRSEKKTFAAGSTGGEYNHQLTVGELAQHNHTGNAANTNITGQLNFSRRLGDTITSSGVLSHESYSTDVYALSWGQQFAGSRIKLAASHGHTLTINNTGANNAHNNLQPYIAVYIFRRTA